MPVHQPGRLGHARVGGHGGRIAVHELPCGFGGGDVPAGPVRQVHRVQAVRVPAICCQDSARDGLAAGTHIPGPPAKQPAVRGLSTLPPADRGAKGAEYEQ